MDKLSKTTSREDDYRDFEERDVNDGWPYADGAPGTEKKPANAAYGEGSTNLDEDENPGFERSDDTAIDTANGVDLFGDESESDVDDDAHEDMIANALVDHDIETGGIEIKVRRGVVLLTGAVETEQERLQAEQIALRIPGIVDVRNRLSKNGVDGNIPADWDE